MFEKLSAVEQSKCVVEKLVKIISQNDTEVAAKIMFDIMKDCMCAEVVGTPNEICQKVNALVDFAMA